MLISFSEWFSRSWRHRPLSGPRRDVLLMLAAQSWYKLSGFVLLIVMSRRLTAAEIGVFFFAVAFAESLLVFANFSLNSVMSRRVAADPRRASDHFSPLLGFRSTSGPVWLIVVTVAGVAFTSAGWRVMLAAALLTLLEDIYFSFGSLFLAMRKVSYNVAIGLLVHTLFVIVFLVAMLRSPSLGALVGAHLLRSFCLVGAALILTQRRLFKLHWSWDMGFVRAGFPFILIALLHAGRDQVGTLMLGFLAGYDAVAQYNLANRVVAASLFVPTAICAVLVPLLVADRLSVRNRAILSRAVVSLGVAGATIGAVVWLFSMPIASALYGPLANSIGPPLRWLSALFPVGFLALFLSLVLQALYQERKVLRVLVAVTSTNILLNLMLIPSLGVKGAVLSQVLSSALQLVMLAWLLLRLMKHPDAIAGEQRVVVLSDDIMA